LSDGPIPPAPAVPWHIAQLAEKIAAPLGAAKTGDAHSSAINAVNATFDIFMILALTLSLDVRVRLG
jgi:hypothetical protein